tara:strand:- start:1522 stop:2868 length:1347 start_codon:yes stop_codon:yes gene_type:complete
VLSQQTLRKPARISGAGLHSGNKVNLTLLPSPAGSGVRFRRVDLDGKPEIEALIDNVSDTQRSTTLAKGSIRIHTVEHVLAALVGNGIDNAVIELDANEPPIGDGSSIEFDNAIRKSGAESQDDSREIYRLSEPIEVQLGESHIAAFPHDGFKISCTSADARNRYTQFYSLELSPDSWANELSRARTFCFYEEIEHLYQNGLIKGGSLENAVVVRDDAVLTNEPLRYPNEFVRHKMLDILGDLALVGRPLQAHIVATRPGHAANCELARQIQAQIRKPLQTAQTFAPPPAVETAKVETIVEDGAELDVTQVMKILPHRFPFLMVDRVTKIDGNQITAIKNVSVGEPYFEGHFPGHPIMPGVMQLEAIAQVGGILMLKKAENLGKLAYFTSADNVKWRRPVHPGDVLTIEVELLKSRGKIGKAKGTCLVDGEIVSEANVTFMLFSPDDQ